MLLSLKPQKFNIMKKFINLVTLQFIAIFYFTACASIDEYGLTQSVAPVVTNGTWKVNSYVSSNNNQTGDFTGYQFVFAGGGTFTATKNGTSESGVWAEDNISKKVTLHIITNDATLDKLNDNWSVSGVSTREVRMDCDKPTGDVHLNITNQ